MSSEMTRLVGELFHGWWDLFTLFIVLIVSTAVMGLAANRGSRPVDRTPVVPALPFIGAFALLLVVRHLHNDLWNAMIIAVGITLSALVVAKSGTRAPVFPLMLLAVLLGLGLNLSAIALLLATVLVLAFSRSSSK